VLLFRLTPSRIGYSFLIRYHEGSYSQTPITFIKGVPFFTEGASLNWPLNLSLTPLK